MEKRGILILILVLVSISPVYSLEQEIKIDFVGADFELYKNDVLNIEIGMQKYPLDVKKITKDYVEIKITNQVIKLSEYYPIRRFDADDDGYYDMVIALKEIRNNKIVLNIKKIKAKDAGWIAFEDIPVIEKIDGKEKTETKKIKVKEQIEKIDIETNETIDNKELFEKLMQEETKKKIKKEMNPLTNLTNFSKTYLNKVKTAIVQVPYIGFIISGLVILSVLILLMEFVLDKRKKKVKKKKIKKKKTVFEKVIDFLLEEEG